MELMMHCAALLDAADEGFTFRQVLELAMDDNTASDRALEYLGRVHDVYVKGTRLDGEPEVGA